MLIARAPPDVGGTRGEWMRRLIQWVLAVGVVAVVVGPPAVLFRAQYAHAKRLREVTAGRFYRSGQMTAAGLRETIERYKIKTVINLQHEDEDPLMPESWQGKPAVRESEVCRRLNVRYEKIFPDLLPTPNDITRPPPTVGEFLKLLDDESVYPVLLHCKAGLHRTGRLTAIYRMEYEGWGTGEALRELRANGYGYHMASDADDFIVQFVQNYRPRAAAAGTARRAGAEAGAGGGGQ